MSINVKPPLPIPRILTNVPHQQLILEFDICSGSNNPLHLCEHLTIWQHACTAALIVNMILDFYGQYFVQYCLVILGLLHPSSSPNR